MEERGVDSSRSGRDKERAFLYGAVNVHPPPPKKMRSFMTDAEVVRFSKRILVNGICLFVCYLGCVV